LPIGVPAWNWVFVVSGSCVGLLDQIHSFGALTFPATPQYRDHDRACRDIAGLVGDRDAVQVGQHLLVAAVERVASGH
jgi:hypothetical protein